jgi:hypothetical protein
MKNLFNYFSTIFHINYIVIDLFSTYIERINPNGGHLPPIFPVESWNMHNSVIIELARTNNGMEGFHNAFNRKFPAPRPKLSRHVCNRNGFTKLLLLAFWSN